MWEGVGGTPDGSPDKRGDLWQAQPPLGSELTHPDPLACLALC